MRGYHWARAERLRSLALVGLSGHSGGRCGLLACSSARRVRQRTRGLIQVRARVKQSACSAGGLIFIIANNLIGGGYTKLNTVPVARRMDTHFFRTIDMLAFCFHADRRHIFYLKDSVESKGLIIVQEDLLTNSIINTFVVPNDLKEYK